MTANMFGERFFGRTPAWHQLGKVLAEGVGSTEEGFVLAGLDYQILTFPIEVAIPTGGRPKKLEYPNRYALVREPTTDDPDWVPLGLVSAAYDVIQNMELAGLLDSLGMTKTWTVETVGALGRGESIFVSYKNGESDVLGLESEHLEHYFLVTDKRDGKTALKLAFTPIRVVCQNTLVAGLRAATRLSNISHVKGLQVEISDRTKLMAGLDGASKKTLALFDALAAYKATGQATLGAMAAAYPMPSRPQKVEYADAVFAGMLTAEGYGADITETSTNGFGNWSDASLGHAQHVYQRECARVESIRSGALERLERFNDEHKKVARTGWAVYNAVVEHEDFRDGPEGLYASALWGPRANAKVACLNYLAETMGYKG